MTEDAQKNPKRGAPQWALQPFRDFVDFTERLSEVVELSTTGISTLRGMPRVVEIIAKVEDRLEHPDSKARLEHARHLAELAVREHSSGFPLVHAQAVVTLWGGLEDVIRTFVAKWLTAEPQVLQAAPLCNVKVTVGQYEALTHEERGIFLTDALDRALNGALKQGVGRFEALLEPLGLSGAVAEDLRKNIFELAQLRNAIAHRRGIVDRRLLENCPWLGYAVGAEIAISHNDFRRYRDAVLQYTTELIYRVGEHFGVQDIREPTK